LRIPAFVPNFPPSPKHFPANLLQDPSLFPPPHKLLFWCSRSAQPCRAQAQVPPASSFGIGELSSPISEFPCPCFLPPPIIILFVSSPKRSCFAPLSSPIGALGCQRRNGQSQNPPPIISSFLRNWIVSSPNVTLSFCSVFRSPVNFHFFSNVTLWLPRFSLLCAFPPGGSLFLLPVGPAKLV